MEDIRDNDQEQQRPLAMTLLAGLYLFFFLLTVSSFGQPYPLLGVLYQGREAEALVFVDSLLCLYLFLGVVKRQRLTWYLLLGYNLFELANTILNLVSISAAELRAVVGETVDPQELLTGNLTVIVFILLLSAVIIRHRSAFINRSRYLFFN
ncbi:MAG TPA: hypothetical protein HPP94_10800 [Desulfuromonadales bacterium]|nr:hypothetical protein [Desulfuromonadales bacterium]